MQTKELMGALNRLKSLKSAFLQPEDVLQRVRSPPLPELFTQQVAIADPQHPGLDENIQAEYVWIGGRGSMDLRSKARTISGPVHLPKEVPIWNFDGSSTEQAPGENSEVYLQPCAVYRDPFRGAPNVLVLCECVVPLGGGKFAPHSGNTRSKAKEIFEELEDEEPWYGIEQEYTLLDGCTKWPLGWPTGGYPGPQGPYYCGVGADKAFGRDIADAHYRACLYCGIKISGINAEVMPGQWEFQVGPTVGIAAGDDLWMARYILERVCEMVNCLVSLDPKPIPGDWNGAGAHCNFSTKATRAPGGLAVILKSVQKLKQAHAEHIACYGEGNERRLTGKHETASIEKFTWGVADRGASVRIGRETHDDGCGYFEDRRPSSNMDPYVVTSMILQTSCGELDDTESDNN